MNHTYSALALSALALGTVVLTTTESSALLQDPSGASSPYTGNYDDWPDEGRGYSEPQPTNCAYPGHPVCSPSTTPVEAVEGVVATASGDTRSAGVQMGASALGGAALAFGGMWLYRRHTLAA
jgi:hypothetical protein